MPIVANKLLNWNFLFRFFHKWTQNLTSYIIGFIIKAIEKNNQINTDLQLVGSGLISMLLEQYIEYYYDCCELVATWHNNHRCTVAGVNISHGYRLGLVVSCLMSLPGTRHCWCCLCAMGQVPTTVTSSQLAVSFGIKRSGLELDNMNVFLF